MYLGRSSRRQVELHKQRPRNRRSRFHEEAPARGDFKQTSVLKFKSSREEFISAERRKVDTGCFLRTIKYIQRDNVDVNVAVPY